MKLRSLLTFLGLLGLAVVALLSRHQLNDFWQLLGNLRWYVIVMIVVVQLISYYLNALYYRSILRLFHFEVPAGRLFQGALATNFVNYVLPSLGLAGAGYLSQVLAPEVPRGQSVLAQLTRYAFSALAVLVMMPVGCVLLLVSDQAARPVVQATLWSAAGILVLAVGVLILIQRESVFRRVVAWLGRRLEGRFPKLHRQALTGFVDEFYAGYHALLRKKGRLVVPFAWSIAYIMVEILTFYLVFVAFGKAAGLGIVIMAYLLANIVSIFGGVFFSTGIFELGMAGTLVALGLPLALAVSVTTVYRVLNLAIGLPPGFYFYKKYLP